MQYNNLYLFKGILKKLCSGEENNLFFFILPIKQLREFHCKPIKHREPNKIWKLKENILTFAFSILPLTILTQVSWCCLPAYQCMVGVAGAEILCCILPLTMLTWILPMLPNSVWVAWLKQLQYSAYSPFNHVYLSVCLCCLSVSGRGGWGRYSLLYSPFNHVYLSIACAAYQCLGGVAGVDILCSILPLTMYTWALLVLPISVWEGWQEQLFSAVFSL